MRMSIFPRKKDKSKRYRYSPLQITFVYAFFGVIWILFSDITLHKLVSSRELINQISIIKGWVYVVLTALLIFSLIETLVIRIKKDEAELLKSYEQLSLTNAKLEESQIELEDQNQILVEYQERLYEYAYHDHLTQLPNRRSFHNELLKKTQIPGHKIILILLDVDNFKYVNDLYGHHRGDQVILQIVQKMNKLLGEQMLLFRTGGDEFAVLIETNLTDEIIHQYVSKIQAEFKKFYKEYKIPISLSMGIARFPDHALNYNDLVQYAEMGLHRAKESGKSTYRFYDSALKATMDEKIIYENQLKQALEKQEFILHYQPQIDLKTGKIRGFEALIRWINEDLGFVSPAKFIPIAEETKLIIDIGGWVLEEAIQFAAALNKEKQEDFIISINISSLQLMNEGFHDKVLETLRKYNLKTQCLELEITESVLINGFEGAICVMQKLRDQKIKVALDDFGTGYSSLNYLKQMPISTLKIDKAFIDDIVEDSTNQSILTTIMTLGHNIGLEIIAEGVETQEQVTYLNNNNCDNIQGYFFSKPIAEKTVSAFIDSFSFETSPLML
ncbi:MAG: EAL domain-containing protein [Vallitaleaceae bacterium]|nr:EAL domain-containing protein [Vallitaleaceae bacterium]